MDLGELDPHLVRCFELAWHACASGTIGVGAVLVDAQGAVLAEGSNGLFADAVGPLRGTKIAHAEMNVLAQIDAATDLSAATLYTSLEPCFMCAGATLLARVGTVVIGATDPFMAGADAVLASGPNRTAHVERVVQPDPAWAALSRVLSLHSAFFWIPDSEVVHAARTDEPAVAAVVADLVANATLTDLAETGATLVAVVRALEPRLTALA